MRYDQVMRLTRLYEVKRLTGQKQSTNTYAEIHQKQLIDTYYVKSNHFNTYAEIRQIMGLTCTVVGIKKVCLPMRYFPYVSEQLLSRSVERFRGGLVFKAHGLLFHTTLGSTVITKK